LSHEGVSAVLRGSGTPRWNNLESLVRILVEQQRVGEADVDTVVKRIHTLWRIVDEGLPAADGLRPTFPGVEETDAAERAAPGVYVPGLQPNSEALPVEPIVRPLSREPLIRWDPRQQTLDVFDRQMAVEIFKEVGGVDEQP
jgi:hypothetical protein